MYAVYSETTVKTVGAVAVAVLVFLGTVVNSLLSNSTRKIGKRMETEVARNGGDTDKLGDTAARTEQLGIQVVEEITKVSAALEYHRAETRALIRSLRETLHAELDKAATIHKALDDRDQRLEEQNAEVLKRLDTIAEHTTGEVPITPEES